jgi:transposase
MEQQQNEKRTGNRRPAQMEMVGGKGSRQRAWEAIRKHAGAFTCCQIARKAKVEDDTLYTYLVSLERGGYLSCEKGQGVTIQTSSKWILIRDNGIEAPRVTRDGKPVTQGLGTEAMWRSMRIVGEFNTTELVAHAWASRVNVSEQTAKTYIGALKGAGYLVVVAEARSRGIGKGAVQARYRIAPGKYTGPRPPMIQRTKSVYDPNLGKVVWQEEPQHDDDL